LAKLAGIVKYEGRKEAIVCPCRRRICAKYAQDPQREWFGGMAER